MELTRNPTTTNAKNDPSKKAISLALNGEWAEAAELNRTILKKSPDDVEAMNRLGKSLMELGQYAEAKAVLARVLQLAPYNSIAKKNLGPPGPTGDGAQFGQEDSTILWSSPNSS